MGTPPTSKMTRPVGTLKHVQNFRMHARRQNHTELPKTRTSPCPCPYAFRYPAAAFEQFHAHINRERTFMQTGISGNTRKYTFAPFTTLMARLMTSSAVESCFAVKRTPCPLIRMPYSPYASVVPRVDPPVGIGIRPFWRLAYLTLRGAIWWRRRAPKAPFGTDTGAIACLSFGNAEEREKNENMCGR